MGIYLVFNVKSSFGFFALHQNGMRCVNFFHKILSSQPWREPKTVMFFQAMHTQLTE